MEEVKLLAKIICKPKKNVKNYILKYDDDTITIYTLFLGKDTTDKILCKKFGMYLSFRVARFGVESIGAINKVAQEKFPPLENGYYIGKINIQT